MIEVSSLRKSFGPIRAVDGLSFSVPAGQVTGFLGPNGSGKTTTLRVLLGLLRPDEGTALINGVPYAELEHPTSVVGAALSAAAHPGRTGVDHLLCYAPVLGVSDARCSEVLELVELTDAAHQKVGTYSLGMRQRLALALALMARPQVLLLDEPANGLDPAGIVWLRELLQRLAHQDGCAVLVSSHVLGEVQASADNIVIIDQGQLVHASPMQELAHLASPRVRLSGPDGPTLRRWVDSRGWGSQPVSTGRWQRTDIATASGSAAEGSSEPGAAAFSLEVTDVTAAQVGAAAFADRIELHELTTTSLRLEEVYLQLVSQHRAQLALAGLHADGTVTP